MIWKSSSLIDKSAMFHRYVELPEGKMQSEPAVMKSRTFRQWLEMAGTSRITWIPKLGMKRNMLWPTCQLLHAKNPRHWETSPDVAELKSALLWMMYDDVRKCLVLRQTTERPQNFVMLLISIDAMFSSYYSHDLWATFEDLPDVVQQLLGGALASQVGCSDHFFREGLLCVCRFLHWMSTPKAWNSPLTGLSF